MKKKKKERKADFISLSLLKQPEGRRRRRLPSRWRSASIHHYTSFISKISNSSSSVQLKKTGGSIRGDSTVSERKQLSDCITFARSDTSPPFVKGRQGRKGKEGEKLLISLATRVERRRGPAKNRKMEIESALSLLFFGPTIGEVVVCVTSSAEK